MKQYSHQKGVPEFAVDMYELPGNMQVNGLSFRRKKKMPRILPATGAA